MIFDTLAYAKRLKEAGCPEGQAEVQAEEMSKVIAVISDSLVTKKHHDRSIKELEISLKRDMKDIELRLRYDLTVRMGSMITAAVAVTAVLIKIL